MASQEEIKLLREQIRLTGNDEEQFSDGQIGFMVGRLQAGDSDQSVNLSRAKVGDELINQMQKSTGDFTITDKLKDTPLEKSVIDPETGEFRGFRAEAQTRNLSRSPGFEHRQRILKLRTNQTKEMLQQDPEINRNVELIQRGPDAQAVQRQAFDIRPVSQQTQVGVKSPDFIQNSPDVVQRGVELRSRGSIDSIAQSLAQPVTPARLSEGALDATPQIETSGSQRGFDSAVRSLQNEATVAPSVDIAPIGTSSKMLRSQDFSQGTLSGGNVGGGGGFMSGLGGFLFGGGGGGGFI